MKIRYLNSFDRTFAALNPESQERIKKTLESFLDYLETQKRPKGLGLKKMRNPYWEIRIGLKLKVIFSWDKDVLSFIIVGSHQEIKRFLRRSKSR